MEIEIGLVGPGSRQDEQGCRVVISQRAASGVELLKRPMRTSDVCRWLQERGAFFACISRLTKERLVYCSFSRLIQNTMARPSRFSRGLFVHI